MNVKKNIFSNLSLAISAWIANPFLELGLIRVGILVKS
jgi:hypothetical protein